jgi:hypothetical protein
VGAGEATAAVVAGCAVVFGADSAARASATTLSEPQPTVRNSVAVAIHAAATLVRHDLDMTVPFSPKRPSFPAATSTIEVDHTCVRRRHCRADKTSSTPSASTVPTRAGIGVQQCLPVGEHGVVDCVPARTEFGGDLADGSAVPSDLHGRPPSGPIRERQPGRRDPGVFMGPRILPAPRLRAPQAMLAPPQPHRSAEAGEIGEFHDGSVLHPRPFATVRA